MTETEVRMFNDNIVMYKLGNTIAIHAETKSQWFTFDGTTVTEQDLDARGFFPVFNNDLGVLGLVTPAKLPAAMYLKNGKLKL